MSPPGDLDVRRSHRLANHLCEFPGRKASPVKGRGASSMGGLTTIPMRDDFLGLSVGCRTLLSGHRLDLSDRGAQECPLDHSSTINRRRCDANIRCPPRGNSKMKRSTASRCAFAILIALPLLPVCGFVLNGAPRVVFGIGVTVFFIGVLLLVWLSAASSIPLAGPPPVAKRFRFTIRDLLCLTTVLFGMTMLIVSGLNGTAGWGVRSSGDRRIRPRERSSADNERRRSHGSVEQRPSSLGVSDRSW